MKKKKRARFWGTCKLELIIGIYLSDWPPKSLAGGRHRCVITWDQCPPQACITTKGAPDKSYPHFSLRLVPYSKPACCWLPNPKNAMQVNRLSSEGTTLRQQEHHDATAKITSMLHIRSFLPFENHPPIFLPAKIGRIMPAPQHLQHYWPYHWRKSELPCRGKLQFRAR